MRRTKRKLIFWSNFEVSAVYHSNFKCTINVYIMLDKLESILKFKLLLYMQLQFVLVQGSFSLFYVWSPFMIFCINQLYLPTVYTAKSYYILMYDKRCVLDNELELTLVSGFCTSKFVHGSWVCLQRNSVISLQLDFCQSRIFCLITDRFCMSSLCLRM